MRVFEILAPDGRKVRHKAADLDHARAQVIAGYSVVAEVIGADPGTLEGGYVVPLGLGESPLAALLKMHGDDLRAWLRAEGVVFATKGD